MSVKEFFASVTPESTKFIVKSFGSKSYADYQRLKKLFEEGKFEAKSFEDSELNILNFDWQSLERDRNWWWQLQALPFLSWYVNSFELQTEMERSSYFSNCLDAIRCWMKNARQNKNSPLSWHDHAAAFRVRNLSNWLLFCHSVGCSMDNDVRTEQLASLIIEHLDWLQDERNYSRHTNHGFDQAIIGLTICLMFSHKAFEPYRQSNRDRLKDEMTFAFTEEGVHKENSPGYQKTMLGRLKQLKSLAQLGELEISEVGGRYIKKAEDFLKALTMPDGSLPLIGDTRGSDVGLLVEEADEKRVRVYDYSKSGYMIFKGFDGLGKFFFVLLKNCHFSNYHRHDDDLMLYVFYDGKVVFGDGGLLSHNEKDIKRIFLRSHFAHSVPYINKKAVRNMVDLMDLPSLELESNGSVVMRSFMFGEEIQRIVNVSYEGALAITVKDSRVEAPAGEIFSNFFSCHHKAMVVGKKSVDMEFDTFNCMVESGSVRNIGLKQGWGEGGISCSAIYSPDYGFFEDACRFVFGFEFEGEIMIKFSGLRGKVG